MYEGSCKNRASSSSDKRARGGSSNEVHCALELPCITQSTFTTTISHFLPYLCFVSAFESVDRCFSSACRPQSAADLADDASLEAPRFFGRFTVFLHSCRFRSCLGGDSNERG